jgi:hypothetical protein
MGYAGVALEVQNLWLNKQREAAGVTSLRVEPDGNTLDERLTTLARLLELVKEIE